MPQQVSDNGDSRGVGEGDADSGASGVEGTEQEDPDTLTALDDRVEWVVEVVEEFLPPTAMYTITGPGHTFEVTRLST